MMLSTTHRLCEMVTSRLAASASFHATNCSKYCSQKESKAVKRAAVDALCCSTPSQPLLLCDIASLPTLQTASSKAFRNRASEARLSALLIALPT